MQIQEQAVAKLHQLKPMQSIPLVVPITSNAKILEAWRNFQDLKIKLLDNQDFVEIKGERYAKKSTFRKLALAFGISTDVIKEERIENKNSFGYEVTIKAVSPAGRFMTAMGSCHSDERRFNKSSDIRAIAQTRATNRAIADLIGWSAPSAEEMMSEIPDEESSAPVDNQQWLDNIFEEHEDSSVKEKQNGNTQIFSKPITDKQRALLTSLINQKVYDPEEREDRLNEIDSLSKYDASELISEFLSAGNFRKEM